MIKSHKKVTKQYKSRLLFLFLLVDGRIRIRIRIRTNKLWILKRIQKGQNLTGPMGPDPETLFLKNLIRKSLVQMAA
jgi:hypothetical protein